eukprot:14307881-Ditylum_brightwellii.AAC.1
MCNFINWWLKEQGGNSLVWIVYSILNKYLHQDFNIDLNDDQKLQNILKTSSKSYTPKKSDIIAMEK